MESLREALVTLGVDEADLAALMEWPAYAGLGLAERVYRSGLVADAKVVDAFEKLGAKDATSQLLSGTPPPAALGAFSRALAEKHRALPLAIEKRRLIVALLDPADTDTLEKLSFTCGLIIEPRCCRARALFEALHRAYDAAVIKPEPGFLESRRRVKGLASPGGPGGDDVGFDLPPPSTDAAAQMLLRHTAPPSSPMAKALQKAAAQEAGFAVDVDLDDDPSHNTLLSHARDLRPAKSPRVSDAALQQMKHLADTDARAARDSLPPMILRLLVPPLRSCALFVVRSNIAVGWDALTDKDTLTTDAIRDVLIPLTAESVLQRAADTKMVAIGNTRDPTIMERTFFRFMKLPPPRSFVALPVIIGSDTACLIYADRDDGVIDDNTLDELRRVGTALGDALAPLAASGLLEGRRPQPLLVTE